MAETGTSGTNIPPSAPQRVSDGARAGLLLASRPAPTRRATSAGRPGGQSMRQGLGARRRRRMLNDHALFRGTASGRGAAEEDEAEWLRHSKISLEYRSIFGHFVTTASPEALKAFRDGQVHSAVVTGMDQRQGHNFVSLVPRGVAWAAACDAYARVRPDVRECLQAEVARMDAVPARGGAGHMLAAPAGGGPGLDGSVLWHLEEVVMAWAAGEPLPPTHPVLAAALTASPAPVTTVEQLEALAAPPAGLPPVPKGRSKAARRQRARAQLTTSLGQAPPLPALQLPTGVQPLPGAQQGLALALASSQHRLMLHGLATYHGLRSRTTTLPGSKARVTLLQRKEVRSTTPPPPAPAAGAAAADAAPLPAVPLQEEAVEAEVVGPSPSMVALIQAVLAGRARELSRPVSPPRRRRRQRGAPTAGAGAPLRSTSNPSGGIDSLARSLGMEPTDDNDMASLYAAVRAVQSGQAGWALPSRLGEIMAAQGRSASATVRQVELWTRAASARRQAAQAVAGQGESVGRTMLGARAATAAAAGVGDVLFEALAGPPRSRSRTGSARRRRQLARAADAAAVEAPEPVGGHVDEPEPQGTLAHEVVWSGGGRGDDSALGDPALPLALE